MARLFLDPKDLGSKSKVFFRVNLSSSIDNGIEAFISTFKRLEGNNSFQPHLSSLILPRREKKLCIDSALYRQHQCSRLAECVKGNFYFNLLHWDETAEPEHGGHAELHVSAVSGSGKQSKRKTIYSWILSWQFSHYIIATLLHMKPYLLNLQSRSWRTTVRIIVYSGGRLSE